MKVKKIKKWLIKKRTKKNYVENDDYQIVSYEKY